MTGRGLDELSDDRAIDAWLMETIGDTGHICGTCRMGAADDPRSVVDPGGRVLGVDGLWVADASVFPAVPRANTNLPDDRGRRAPVRPDPRHLGAGPCGGRSALSHMSAAAQPFDLGRVTLRNRAASPPPTRAGSCTTGCPVAGDAEYWGRLAAGGAAMLIGGGTVIAPGVGAAARQHPGGVAARDRRAVAPRGSRRSTPKAASRSASSCTSGRETLGAESYYSPVAPAAVRSPREPTAPRAMLEREVDGVVEGVPRLVGQRLRGRVRRDRAARRARLPARAVPVAADQPGAATASTVLERVIAAIRALSSPRACWASASASTRPRTSALDAAELAEMLRAVDPLVDWVNVTVGVRTTYVRDMATDAAAAARRARAAAAAGARGRCSSPTRSASRRRSRRRWRAAPTWSAWRGR